MPRAVDARLGDDGYGIGVVHKFWLTPRQSNRLFEFFSEQAGSSLASLSSALSDIGTQYRRGAGRGTSAFRRAQACKALDIVLALPAVECRDILSLNGRAEDAVHNELVMMKGGWQKDDFVYEKLHSEQLDPALLRSACEAARDRMMMIKGADKNAALEICASQLCEFYESSAGARITLSNRELDRGYTRMPRSEGARFVCEALVMIAGRGDAFMKQKLFSMGSGLVRGWMAGRSRRKPVRIPRP